MEIKETSQVQVDTTVILITQIAGNMSPLTLYIMRKPNSIIVYCFHMVSPAFWDIQIRRRIKENRKFLIYWRIKHTKDIISNSKVAKMVLTWK